MKEMTKILIEQITRQTAATKGIVGQAMDIIKKNPEFSGTIGYFSETEMLNLIGNGKIIPVSRIEAADNAETIGVVYLSAENTYHETATYSLAFRQGIRIETIKKILIELAWFANAKNHATKTSISIIADGQWKETKDVEDLLSGTNFKIENLSQRSIKTRDGFKNSWLCSSSMNGRGINPLITESKPTAAPAQDGVIAGLNSEIDSLKKQIKSKDADIELANGSITDFLNRIDSLKRDLTEENAKRLSAEDTIKILKGKMERTGASETISISETRQEIIGYKTAIEQLKNENTQLKELLEKKNGQSVESGEKTEQSITGDITPLKALNIQLENTINDLRKSLEDKTRQVYRQIELIKEKDRIIAALQNGSQAQVEDPVIDNPEEIKEAAAQQGIIDPRIATDNITVPEPLIEKPDIKQEPEVVSDNNSADQTAQAEKIILNKNQRSVLEIIVQCPGKGITHKDLRAKMIRCADETDSSLQVRASSAIIFLYMKKLITNEKIENSREKIVTPILPNIAKYFPDLVNTVVDATPPAEEVPNSNTGISMDQNSEEKILQTTETISVQTGEKNPIRLDNEPAVKRQITENRPDDTVADQTQKKDIQPAQPLSDFDRMVNLLATYGEGGINGSILCEKAVKELSMHFSVAKTILFNIKRKDMLKYVARADKDDLMNSIIALKQIDAKIRY